MTAFLVLEGLHAPLSFASLPNPPAQRTERSEGVIFNVLFAALGGAQIFLKESKVSKIY